MAKYNNPFLTRFSDRTGMRNADFLSTYASQVIDTILKKENLLLPKTTWIVGIPGSGKSSILRLFSIEILDLIKKQKETYPHLYEPLASAGVIVDNVIRIVGIYVQVDELFLEGFNVNIPGVDNSKLFCTLLDLRIARQISTILRVIFKKNEELGEVPILKGVDSSRLPPKIFSENIDAIALEAAIKEQENLISNLLTSFPGAEIPENLDLHSRCSGLDFIQAQNELHNVQFILMIDDVHELYQEQYDLLKKTIELRNSFPRWVATRKHIYPLNLLVEGSTGITDGRETETLDIDQELSKNTLLYKKFIKNLVDKRLKQSPTLSDITIDQIEGIIPQVSIEEYLYSTNVAEKITDEIRRIVSRESISSSVLLEITDTERAVSPLDLEFILIKANRFARKKQLELFPQLSFDLSNVPSKDKQAAELFLKKRVGMPLGSGFDLIIDASNHNVEQFLRVFSPFIDRLIYRVQLDKNRTIKPDEQIKLLKKAANNYMESIIKKLLYGNYIYKLVDNLGRFFNYRTYEPNAPHAPGVTQFAILQSDLDQIKDGSKSKNDGWLVDLTRILTFAISNNVIFPEGSQSQGAKGSEKKVVFSLNRLLCIYYDLPLQRGDFQQFSMEFLWRICNDTYKPEEIRSRRLGKQLTLWGV